MYGRPFFKEPPNLSAADFDDGVRTSRGASIGGSIGTILGAGLGMAFPPALMFLPLLSGLGSMTGAMAGRSADRKAARQDYDVYKSYRDFMRSANDATRFYAMPESAYYPDFSPSRYAALRLGTGKTGPSEMALAARNYGPVNSASRIFASLALAASLFPNLFRPKGFYDGSTLPDLSQDTMQDIKNTFFPR
jgi:hypothetical protein